MLRDARYGERRLPLLLAGWEDVARVGWEEARLRAEASYLRSYEPIFVLGRNGTADARLDNAWAIDIATASGEITASPHNDGLDADGHGARDGAAKRPPLRSEL